MAPSYKEHPIPVLRGASLGNDKYARPTQAEYEDWWSQPRKNVAAVGHAYIGPMALALGFERGVYLPLAPDMPVDLPDNPIFQSVVVTMAINHGGLQALPKKREPLADAEHCAKNYYAIV